MRIIAGLYKGRELLPPPGRCDTRPITGAVKKSLFGMLGEDLTGQRVVDLYCGTGTLGIEALSAVRSIAASPSERSRWSSGWLETFAIAARAKRRQSGEATLKAAWPPGWTRRPGTIDVAFVDPPYATAREWWPESPSREGAEGELPVLTHRASVIEAIFAPLGGGARRGRCGGAADG